MTKPQYTMLEIYRLIQERNAPPFGTYTVIRGDDYEKYEEERDRNDAAIEALKAERRKMKDISCKNCEHLGGVHALFNTCHGKDLTGCPCPEFVPVNQS